MEEIEDPTERVQEAVHEHAHHRGDSYSSKVALTTAILAVLAAVSSMLSGHFANDAMIEQIKASDHWAYYQAKGIKAAVLDSRIQILQSLGKPVAQDDLEQHAGYKDQQDEIATEAKREESASEAHLVNHMIFARSVTFLQVAIAICAVAVLSRKRLFWYIGIGLGVSGSALLLLGFRPELIHF